MTIYLVKKWTGINNTEIGDLFGGLSYSAVSKINTRFSYTLKTDKKLRRGVREIIENLSHVKACPHSLQIPKQIKASSATPSFGVETEIKKDSILAELV